MSQEPDIAKIIARNKRASFEYFIEERLEAGIVLTGSEVKSLRLGKSNIEDTYATFDGSNIVLYNCHIAEYEKSRLKHQERRPRRLLLHRGQIKKIIGKIKLKGYSLVALNLYFNSKNLAKIELGVARGKKLHDKRESLKQQDWQRQQGQLMRQK